MSATPAPEPIGANDLTTAEQGTPGNERLTQHALPERYELLEEVARGGMGVVVRVRDRIVDRPLALKTLHYKFRQNEDLTLRFVAEARITGQLQHPGIPPVHDLGTLRDGRPYFTMKLVQGRTLADLLAQRPTHGEGLAGWVQVFEHVCQAVAYAHSRGVIHRDLKPANVMVGAFGEVQVMDWGLAKPMACSPETATPPRSEEFVGITRGPCGDPVVTAIGSVMGSFAYMPPEQARGDVDKLDTRSDIFALGAVLCEILTGNPPYLGSTAEELHRNATSGRLEESFVRLDCCGADRELVQLA